MSEFRSLLDCGICVDKIACCLSQRLSYVSVIDLLTVGFLEMRV